jgi:hypothetical protein
MAFRLVHIITGETADFSTQDVLDILGDPINDEIVIKGEVYRLSTFEDAGGDGSLPQVVFRTTEFIVPDSETVDFQFINDASPDSVLLTLNGKVCIYGEDKDFHIAHNVILWHGGLLHTNDIIVARYLDYNIA